MLFSVSLARKTIDVFKNITDIGFFDEIKFISNKFGFNVSKSMLYANAKCCAMLHAVQAIKIDAQSKPPLNISNQYSLTNKNNALRSGTNCICSKQYLFVFI